MSEVAAFSGLSHQSNLPLSWSLQMADEGRYSHEVEQNNLNRLQIILSLDESSRELHEEESALAAEIQRLDLKINIVLELVSHLVIAGKEMPESVAVTLNPSQLIFDAKNPPPLGGRVLLNLFLDLRFPFSLVLQGQVDSLEEISPQSFRVGVVLDPFSEPLQEMLEKYIFRCHRRHIAWLKKSGG